LPLPPKCGKRKKRSIVKRKKRKGRSPSCHHPLKSQSATVAKKESPGKGGKKGGEKYISPKKRGEEREKEKEQRKNAIVWRHKSLVLRSFNQQQGEKKEKKHESGKKGKRKGRNDRLTPPSKQFELRHVMWWKKQKRRRKRPHRGKKKKRGGGKKRVRQSMDRVSAHGSPVLYSASAAGRKGGKRKRKEKKKKGGKDNPAGGKREEKREKKKTEEEGKREEMNAHGFPCRVFCLDGGKIAEEKKKKKGKETAALRTLQTCDNPIAETRFIKWERKRKGGKKR